MGPQPWSQGQLSQVRTPSQASVETESLVTLTVRWVSPYSNSSMRSRDVLILSMHTLRLILDRYDGIEKLAMQSGLEGEGWLNR